MRALLGRLVDVHPGEGRGLGYAFTYFFCLLSGYYVLRPLRDEMGIAGGVERLPWLFSATFVAMLVAVPAWSALAARVPRDRLIPVVYRSFVACLLLFYALLQAGVDRAWVARVFFVWTSVYNLFVVSVFWGFLADLFRPGEGRRLFGFIAAGGSAGAMAGPALTAALVGRIGPTSLLLVSAVLLEAATWCVRALVRWDRRRGGEAPAARDRPVGGTIWSGLVPVVRSRLLLGVSGHVLLFAATSTFLYFQQAQVVRDALVDPAARTRLFALVDLAVNVLTLLVQTTVTGRLLHRFGVGAALILLPALTALGFLGLSLAPWLAVVASFQALRRAVQYAVERPGREVLFTLVDREQKYKAKQFIDTVVFRGGDAMSGWVQAALTAAGLGVAGTSLCALPLCVIWLGVARSLGRRAAEAGQ